MCIKILFCILISVRSTLSWEKGRIRIRRPILIHTCDYQIWLLIWDAQKHGSYGCRSGTLIVPLSFFLVISLHELSSASAGDVISWMGITDEKEEGVWLQTKDRWVCSELWTNICGNHLWSNMIICKFKSLWLNYMP